MSTQWNYDNQERLNVEGYVQAVRQARAAAAMSLRSTRRALRQAGLGAKASNKVARQTEQIARRYPGSSARRLRAYANARYRFGVSEIPRGLPCGADDVAGQARDYARSLAMEIWRTVGRF